MDPIIMIAWTCVCVCVCVCVCRRAPDSVEDPVYTDCWAELWANRPHPLCDQPTLLSYMAIPLRDYDQAGKCITSL